MGVIIQPKGGKISKPISVYQVTRVIAEELHEFMASPDKSAVPSVIDQG